VTTQRAAGETLTPGTLPPSRQAVDRTEEHWRRNVLILGFSSLVGSASFSFTGPFLPLFLSRELGVTDPSALASWTGTISAAMGISLAVTSPVWGAVGDRFGRKPMLIRALVGSGVFTGLMGFAQGPLEAAFYRFGFGALTGIMHASLAVVAGQAPRAQIGWALGVVTSCFVSGGALGPFLAGLAEPVMGIRGVFLVGGAILVLAGLLVAVTMAESGTPHQARDGGLVTQLRGLPPATRAALVALILAQAFLIMTVGGAQPMVALRILELEPMGAAAATGTAFGLFGLASAGAALLYARPARQFGHRRVASIASALLAAGLLSASTSVGVFAVVASMGIIGLASGSLQPLVRTMLGLEAPRGLLATLYGLNNSAVAVGIAVGPFACGWVAAATNSQVGILVALVPLALASVALAFVREPRPE